MYINANCTRVLRISTPPPSFDGSVVAIRAQRLAARYRQLLHGDPAALLAEEKKHGGVLAPWDYTLCALGNVQEARAL